jgi:hypothetical protein
VNKSGDIVDNDKDLSPERNQTVHNYPNIESDAELICCGKKRLAELYAR